MLSDTLKIKCPPCLGGHLKFYFFTCHSATPTRFLTIAKKVKVETDVKSCVVHDFSYYLFFLHCKDSKTIDTLFSLSEKKFIFFYCVKF